MLMLAAGAWCLCLQLMSGLHLLHAFAVWIWCFGVCVWGLCLQLLCGSQCAFGVYVGSVLLKLTSNSISTLSSRAAMKPTTVPTPTWTLKCCKASMKTQFAKPLCFTVAISYVLLFGFCNTNGNHGPLKNRRSRICLYIGVCSRRYRITKSLCLLNSPNPKHGELKKQDRQTKFRTSGSARCLLVWSEHLSWRTPKSSQSGFVRMSSQPGAANYM